MTIGAKPPAEVTIDPSLVLALLQEQHTDLAHLPLIDIGEGGDNKLFRLGFPWSWSIVPQQLDGFVDRVAVLDLWERALSTPPWPGPPSWITGT